MATPPFAQDIVGAVEDAKEPGKKQQKAFGFLLSQVMQKSNGQANPQVVNEILRRKLN